MRCPRCGGDGAPLRVFRVRRSLPPLLFAAGIIASWFVFGEAVEEAVEGMERVRVGLAALVPGGVLFLAMVAWTLHVRRPLCASCPPAGWLTPLPEDRSEALLALPARRRSRAHGSRTGTTP